MKRLWAILLMVCCLGISAAQAIVELDDTVPANSALISTFATKERETRAKVNELITAFSTTNGNSTIETFAEWYGAVGDNETDDTAAFASAIAALNDGGILRLGGGKSYKTNIEIVDKEITIRGNGGQCSTESAVPGLYPYDNTKAVIKASSSVTGTSKAVNIYDVAIYGNKTTSQVGLHLGQGSSGSQVINCCVTGFVVDNILVGEHTDMTAPITSVNIVGTSIRPGNVLGNAIRVKAGATGAKGVGAYEYNWITEVRYDNALMVRWAIGDYDLGTWNEGDSHKAYAVVKATNDHCKCAAASCDTDETAAGCVYDDNWTADWGFVWQTTSDCVSGSTEPAWTSPTVGDTFSDGTCTWTTYQRGRLIDLLGAGIKVSNSYLEASFNYAGVRIEASSAPWISTIFFSNTILTDIPVDYKSVEFENQYNTWTPRTYLMGDLYNTGAYKALGQEPYWVGMQNIAGIGAGGGGVEAKSVQIFPSNYQSHSEVQPYGYLSFDNATNELDISVIPDPWNDYTQQYDVVLQGRGFGNVRIPYTIWYFNGPHLVIGSNHMWPYRDTFRVTDYEPDNETAGHGLFLDGFKDGNLTQTLSYNSGGIYSYSVVADDATAAIARNIAGANFAVYLNDNDTITGLFGVEGAVNNNVHGTITNSAGVWGVATTTTGSDGNVTNASSFLASIQNNGSGIITNAAGFKLESPTNGGGGTITNLYGLYIPALTVGTNKWSIWTGATGDVQFGVLAGTGTRYVTVDANGKLAAGGVSTTAGTAAAPLTSAYIGDAATNNINLTGTSASAVTVTIPGQTGTVTVAPTTTTAGKVLQGTTTAGLGAWSTPTYPSTSGTARKMLVSDGTNNVYSTELWPVPGAANGIMTSDGTDWTRSTTLSGLTFVAPVLGAATGTTLSLSTPKPTPGSGTGVTVNDAGSLRTQVYKVTVTYAGFVTAGVTHDLTLATMPAKSIIHAVIADVTEAFVCAATCTTATLSATVGISAGGVEFLESFDIDAAIATFGDADDEVGSKLDVAGATNGGYISWAGTPVIMRATSGTGNWGNGAATNANAGSITFYILYSVLP